MLLVDHTNIMTENNPFSRKILFLVN